MSATPARSGSRLDPEPIPRRDFLGLAARWAAGSALLVATFGLLKLPKAAVLSSPSRKFRVNVPENLAAGQPFVPPGRSVALFRDAKGVYAISIVCTHLGCIVKSNPDGFECPCHGSRFASNGEVKRGPAPRPLPWRKVVPAGADYIVDEDVTVPAGTRA